MTRTFFITSILTSSLFTVSVCALFNPFTIKPRYSFEYISSNNHILVGDTISGRSWLCLTKETFDEIQNEKNVNDNWFSKSLNNLEHYLGLINDKEVRESIRHKLQTNNPEALTDDEFTKLLVLIEKYPVTQKVDYKSGCKEVIKPE